MLSEKVAFMLAIEPGKRPPPGTSNVFDSLVEFCVRNFQPAPVMMHIELFVAPRADQPLDRCMFATYYGEKSGWGEDKRGSKSWYVEGKNTWRAVPLSVDADAIRDACGDETDAPYSLCMYIPSVFPFRFLSGLMRSAPKGWAHCASLTARIIRTAGLNLNHNAAWYSPSTLWAELDRPTNTCAYAVGHTWMLNGGCEYAGTLTRGTDEVVKGMTENQCLLGIAYLGHEVRSSPKDADLQRNLATGILRYAITNRRRE